MDNLEMFGNLWVDGSERSRAAEEEEEALNGANDGLNVFRRSKFDKRARIPGLQSFSFLFPLLFCFCFFFFFKDRPLRSAVGRKMSWRHKSVGGSRAPGRTHVSGKVCGPLLPVWAANGVDDTLGGGGSG
jgi:hypothetical protein